MSPYLRNYGWRGIGQGKWTDEDFLLIWMDFLMMSAKANWFISKEIMIPTLKNVPKEYEGVMISSMKNSIPSFFMQVFGFLYLKLINALLFKKLLFLFYILCQIFLYIQWKQSIFIKIMLKENLY